MCVFSEENTVLGFFFTVFSTSEENDEEMVFFTVFFTRGENSEEMVFFTVFFTENTQFQLSLNKVPFSTCKKFPHEIILETLLPLRKVAIYDRPEMM